MKLLVAVDGSEHALHALQYAIRLARENGPVSIHLVTAHEEPAVYGEIAIYVTIEKMMQLQRQEADLILEFAEKVLKEAGIPYTREILIGNIPTVICQCADAHHCHGIVLGSRGMTALGNIVIGSVASRVAHLSKVPVTLVR